MNHHATIAGIAAVLVGCAGQAKDGVANDSAAKSAAIGQSDAGTPTNTRDACELITTTELTTAIAARRFIVDTSGPVPRNSVGTGNRNSSTSCTFAQEGVAAREMMTFNVMVVTSPSDAMQPTVEQMKKGVMSLGLNAVPVDIAGLGDAAYWVNLGSAQRSSIAINVKLDARRWLTVGESSTGQGVDETVARLTKLAQLAVSRL